MLKALILTASLLAMPAQNAAERYTITSTVTILNTATTSDTLEVPRGARFARLSFDSAFDGTALALHTSTAASSGFQAAYDTDGTAVSWTVAASQDLVLGSQAINLLSARWVRFVAGAQTGDTVITVEFILW